MTLAAESLGLTPEELRRHADCAVMAAGAADEEPLEFLTPGALGARRIAWDAAAALIAANNRRLTEQLRRLGALADEASASAAPPSDAPPG
jgi:hypothetical protein